MTEDTQPGANRKVRPAGSTRARKARVLKDTAEAEHLKAALFAALDGTGLNLKEIAERCGLAKANRLYNLRNGHTNMLSIQTYLALSRHLDLPINELLGLPERKPASMREDAALQVASERFVLSLAYVRAATAGFYEQHVEPKDPSRDPTAQIQLQSSFLRIDCGLEALTQDITALLTQLRKVVPELPPLPPL